jgi:hypothetical protein
MKKVFTLIAFFVLLLNYSKGQVRLNEVSAVNNSNKKQFIELFAPVGVSSEYKLLIRYNNSASDNGFYVLSLTATAPSAPYYFLTQFNSSSGTWTNTTSILKVSHNGNLQSTTGLDYNELIKPTGENMIFLIKGNRVIDLLVYGGGVKYSAAQTQINSWLNFTPNSITQLSGLNVSFQGLSVTNFNAPNETAGQGSSMSFFYSNSGCDILSYPWQKTSSETPAAINKDGNKTSAIPTYTYWESSFYLYPGDRTSPVQTTTGNIGVNSSSFDYNNLGLAKHFYFEYAINNSTINPLGLTSEPSFKVYIDNGETSTSNPDESFDPAIDTDITGIVDRKFTSPNIFKVNFQIDISANSNMYFTVGSSKYLRPIHVVLQSTNSCKIESFMFKSAQIFNLPVTLKQFEVRANENIGLVKWITSSEQNNKGFEVQRSIGNTNDFKTIGFVGTRAKDGNSQTEINYSFEDTDVKLGQTHFYRLNQIDFDGKSAFSPVKSIKPGSIESNLNVYPNPSQGSFTVNTGSTSGKLNIFVMDNTGRVVNQYMNVSTTNTKISNLKKGFYTLKIINTESGEQSAQRVVVQ